MTKVNRTNENETKSDIFKETYLNLTSFFIGHKKLKYLNGFYSFLQWLLSISLLK